MKGLFEEWITSKKGKESEDVLIKSIISAANASWRTERARTKKGKTFDQFFDALKLELEDSGLMPEYVEQILNGLKP